MRESESKVLKKGISGGEVRGWRDLIRVGYFRKDRAPLSGVEPTHFRRGEGFLCATPLPGRVHIVTSHTISQKKELISLERGGLNGQTRG